VESIKSKFRALIKDFLKSEQEEPVSKPKQQYADTIVRNPSGEILLLQRSYNDDFMAGKWCLPGGKIEAGEEPLIAAKRELFEETGIDNNQIIEFFPLTTIEKDDCIIHYFEAILEDGEPLMVLDNEEHFRYEFTTISKLDRYDLILDLGEVITNNLQSLLSDMLMKSMELLPIELVYKEEQPVNESLVKAEDVNNAFDEGLISDDDYLHYQEINKAVSEITQGYDTGMVSEKDFFTALNRLNDFEFIKGEDGNYLFIDNDIEVGLRKAEELGLLDPDATELEKGRKAMPVGTKAVWGGIHYLKTATGWKPVGKHRGHVKENHDFIHENEEKEKDHLTMVHDAGKMESEAWVEKHGSNLHSKYKQVHDYLHKERVKRERKQQETKPTEEKKEDTYKEPPPIGEGHYKSKNEEGRAYKLAQGFKWNGEDWVHPDYPGKSVFSSDVPKPKKEDVLRELAKIRGEKPAEVTDSKDKVIGKTSSGKDIYDNPSSEQHKDFTSIDHGEAAAIHNELSFGDNNVEHHINAVETHQDLADERRKEEREADEPERKKKILQVANEKMATIKNALSEGKTVQLVTHLKAIQLKPDAKFTPDFKATENGLFMQVGKKYENIDGVGIQIFGSGQPEANKEEPKEELPIGTISPDGTKVKTAEGWEYIKKPSEPEQAEEPTGNSLGLNVSMYSEKSILITGDTYKNLELLRGIKKDVGPGSWNKALNGWIFPANAKDKIMAAIGGKIDTSTAEGTKQKEAAIEMKNAVDPGTTIELPVTHTEPEVKEETKEEKKEEPAVEEPKTEEAKVTDITTNEDGKVEYTVETEDGTKVTVTEEEIAIPPATDEKAQELINNANEENRMKTGKMLFGKEAGELPVSDKIEQEGQKDVQIEVKEFTTRSGKKIQALDFTGITQSDIQLANQNGILEKEKPYYIPDINEKFFAYTYHSLTYVKQDDNSFIVSLNGTEEKFKHYPGNTEADHAVVSLDQLVAIEDYYYKKAKAQHALDKIEYLKKRAEGIRDWKESQLSFYKPFNYAYTTKEQQKKYTKDQWDNLSIDEKIAEFPYMKSHPFKFNKLNTLKDGQITYAKYDMYKELVDNNVKGRTSSEAYSEFRSIEKLFGFKEIDMKCQKEDNDSSYEKGRETSYGDSNLEDHLYDSHGVKIKAQNGKGLSESQVQDIKTHLSKAYQSFGDRSSMSKQFGLKISHAGDFHMHASKFSGVYIPSMKAIGVGNTYNSFGFTLAHEISHFIDNYAGKKQGRHFASDDYNSTAGKIASTFRKHMNKASDSDYMNRSCENFARAFEMYHAIKHEGDNAVRFGGVKYYDDPNQVNKEVFEGKIKPLIEQFLKENDHLLKSAYDELNLIDLNNSFELIKASFDNNEIGLPEFIKAVNNYNEISKGDPSHGGKLIKKVIINKMGKKETTWVKRGDEDDSKENGNKATNEPVKHSQKVLSAFAAETPEAKLKEVINNSTDEKLRAAAHAELDRRSKKEKVQEDKEKKVSL
jgi:mutator protein MutT